MESHAFAIMHVKSFSNFKIKCIIFSKRLVHLQKFTRNLKSIIKNKQWAWRYVKNRHWGCRYETILCIDIEPLYRYRQYIKA